ncbi:hypothetical protein [Novosphingobium jiangmenense]|uniref:Uncharacterized protein n=1 Tax=Novosphingobium jiangmenense TaxID=2791981 RepID=A0ABS0HI82_9SPHN|nr:hypothetical protein [Novosphingobium jiangmenense]MBF9151916.1 hypothetical protein [Novosphingobium jiangmenense]
MSGAIMPHTDPQRLREIASHLRQAFGMSDQPDLTLSDLAAAVDSPELATLYHEIRALQEEHLQRIERTLARVAANDR